MVTRLALCLLLSSALACCSPATSQDFELNFESKGCGEGILVLYQFTIHGDGRVDYFGRRGVKLLGHQEGRIDASQARELWLEAETLHLLDLEDRYWPTGWSDFAGFEISLRGGERRNSIDFAWFDPADNEKPSSPEEEACAQLSAFGRKLEAAVEVSRWIGTEDEIYANRFWLERDRDSHR